MIFKLVVICVVYNLSIVDGRFINFTKKNRVIFPSDCGRPRMDSESRRQTRIINGNDASVGEYPWHVFISIDGAYKCGGSLINREWVITAAHCVKWKNEKSLILRFGEHDWKTETEPYKSVSRKVKKVIIHPKFSVSSIKLGNDLALIKLSEPVNYQPHIQPICLPAFKTGEDDSITEAIVTGWGKTFHKDPTPGILQEMSVPIMNISTCKKILTHKFPKSKIDDKVICAGYNSGKRAACHGDSGSPLKVKKVDGRWYILGVTSWGSSNCNGKNHPIVFMKVSYFLPWIRRQLMKYGET